MLAVFCDGWTVSKWIYADMAEQDDDHYPWGLEAIKKLGAQTGEDAPVLFFETIQGVEPLGDQLGVLPPKTVPDALHEPFFGQPKPSEVEVAQYGSTEAVPPMRTYAILDAAKVFGLPEILESSGLECRCLFKGDAYDDLKDVAPWIVRLEDGNPFVRHQFTAGKEPWLMWGKEAGVYVRSRASFDDMWRHFRKFTRVQDQNGKWYYFRFWEPSMLVTAVRLISGSASFQDQGKLYHTLIDSVCVIAVTGEKCYLMETNWKDGVSNLRVDVPFLEFVYVIARSGLHDEKDAEIERAYNDVSRLWASGIRDKEILSDFIRIKKSAGLPAVARGVLDETNPSGAGHKSAVRYLARLVQ